MFTCWHFCFIATAYLIFSTFFVHDKPQYFVIICLHAMKADIIEISHCNSNKLDNTLVIVDVKFNPLQTSDKFHINKNTDSI